MSSLFYLLLGRDCRDMNGKTMLLDDGDANRQTESGFIVIFSGLWEGRQRYLPIGRWLAFFLIFVLPLWMNPGSVWAAGHHSKKQKNSHSLRIPKNKVGKFDFEMPGGPAKDYLEMYYEFGLKPDGGQVRSARKGVLKWITFQGHSVTYVVIVPKTYDPGVPHGVIVFINSANEGELPKPYQKFLSEYNLIAIGAQKAGNNVNGVLRQVYAIQAAHLIEQSYNVDPDRVYVTGISGGGRVASHAMVMNSDVFTGGIPIIGANACLPMIDYDSAGDRYMDSGDWKRRNTDRLRLAATRNRYAFLEGGKDPNRFGSKAVAVGYKQRYGFRYVTYIEQPGLKHHIPSADIFEKALAFLDGPLVAKVKSEYASARQMDKAGQSGQALALYRKAVGSGYHQAFQPQAIKRLKALDAQYQAALKKVKDAIAAHDHDAYTKSVGDLAAKWRPLVDRYMLQNLYKQFLASQAKSRHK